MNRSIFYNLVSNKDSLAKETMQEILRVNPSLIPKYTKEMEKICIQDLKYHIEHLAEALYLDTGSLFQEYINWANQVLVSRNIPKKQLILALRSMQKIFQKEFDENEIELGLKYIDFGIELLNKKDSDKTEAITESYIKEPIAKKYLDFLLSAKRRKANKMILNLVSQGKPIKEIFLEIFQPVQYEIGRLWQINEISVAQEHYGTACTQSIISGLYPRILSTEKIGKTMIATCINDELHELGIRMIADFFEMEGWDTYYLGANTPIKSIVNYLIQKDADLLAISATLTKHLSSVETLIKKIKDSEAQNIKIIVGGYPFNIIPNLWKRVGADAFAKNASDAIKVGNSLT